MRLTGIALLLASSSPGAARTPGELKRSAPTFAPPLLPELGRSLFPADGIAPWSGTRPSRSPTLPLEGRGRRGRRDVDLDMGIIGLPWDRPLSRRSAAALDALRGLGGGHPAHLDRALALVAPVLEAEHAARHRQRGLALAPGAERTEPRAPQIGGRKLRRIDPALAPRPSDAERALEISPQAEAPEAERALETSPLAQALESRALDPAHKLEILRLMTPEARREALAALSPDAQFDLFLRDPGPRRTMAGAISSFDWSRDLAPAAGYCPRTAWAMALLSAHSYGPLARHDAPIVDDPANDPRPTLARAGYVVTSFSRREVGFPFFTAQKGDLLLMIFRGTASLDAVLADLNIPPRPGLGGTVHSGALGVHQKIGPFVQRAIDDAIARAPGKLRVLAAGHSLGGVLAIQSAAHLHERDDVEVGGVYTFGSPQFVDPTCARGFAESGLADKIWLVENAADWFARLPRSLPEPLRRLPYVRTGRAVLLGPDGLAREDLEHGTLEALHAEHLEEMVPRKHELPCVRAHSPLAYLKKLYLNHDQVEAAAPAP